MRTSYVLALLVGCCLLGGTGVAAAGTTGATASPSFGGTSVLTSDHVNGCAADPPADLSDPDGDTEDVIGWVEGYWYNEPIDVTGPSLTESELDTLVTRTAARVEALRCLTYDKLPPTEMRTRGEHRSDIESQFETELTEADTTAENARLATALIAGQSTDAIELQLDVRTSFPAAFYDTEAELIGFITDDPDSITIDETTLAHELVHALQNQNADLGPVFEQPTTDRFTSSLAVVEGDATLVEEQYVENCETGAWVDSCIRQQPNPPDVPSWPLTLEQLAAYNTPLVEDTFETEGWTGVNNLLENTPDSTVEALEPDRYGEFEPSLPTVEDLSTAGWNRVDLESRDDEVFGQHALTAVLMAPFYETNGQTEIISSSEFLVDPAAGEISYDHPVTDGWQGDRFYAYTNGEETAGVWRIEWASADGATTFVDAFEDLAEYRGGSLARAGGNVYTFENSDEFDMSMGIQQEGDSILVVTAPTADELTNVHSAFDSQTDSPDDGAGDDDGADGSTGDGGGADDGTGDDGGADGSTGDDDGADGSTGDDDGADDGTGDGSADDSTGDGSTDNRSTGGSADDDGAGFGVLVVAVALVAGLLGVRRRG